MGQVSANAFRKFAADLSRVADSLPAMAARRTRRVAEGAEATAKSVAPVESGALRSNIHTVRRPDGSWAVEARVTSHDDYYAHFQEYGTSRMAPNPFMGPAVDKWGPELVRALEDVADDVAKELS